MQTLHDKARQSYMTGRDDSLCIMWVTQQIIAITAVPDRDVEMALRLVQQLQRAIGVTHPAETKTGCSLASANIALAMSPSKCSESS